ncbi:MAG: Sec-independent protein translocase subunit TatB [Epsilonproteobacteria bacterium]|nr:Sec-independent protein translocase subunit TatB [Campylobacterota bacterium]
MFGMGFSEILMIGVVAIIFLGPEKLPNFLIDIARFFKSVKRAINEAKVQIEQEVKISELKAEAQEYKEKFNSIAKEISTIKSDINDDPLKEVEEFQKALEPKREVVRFKKEALEDKDKVNV